jgi:amidase
VSDILDLDATAQLEALAARKVSSLELLQGSLARYEKLHERLNAVVVTDVQQALERARQIDETRAAGGKLGPLAGLPMTIKDTFDVRDMPASAGLAKFLDRSPEDAAVVANARAAGAVIWGKTNVPVMAGDYQSFNRLYGTTNNPWDLERTPGGSSGGAAACVATGITALEIGSDIGGSLRTPASFCGVFSHKPTYGRVSQKGHIPPAPGIFIEPDLNVVGPIARSARDLALLLAVIEGRTPKPAKPVPVKGLRVGVWLDDPEFIVDAEVRGVIELFVARLEEAGAIVEPIVPVDSKALFDSYMTLLLSLIGADLPASARHSMNLVRPLMRVARELGAGSLALPTLGLGYTATHREWLAADAVRGALGRQMAEHFQRFDIVLAPVNPVTAFHHDHRAITRRKLVCSGGQKIPYLANLQWISLATSLGLPATAFPAGPTDNSLPVGVQLIGPHGADERVLAIAEGIEAELGGFTPPPSHTL